MFIVELTYTVPLEEVDALLEEHRAYLAVQYKAGIFLASGPKVPRTGGIILATAESPDALHKVLEQDPFHREAVARYEVTEFVPVKTADALACVREDPR